jgi:uncharacterized membrane protein
MSLGDWGQAGPVAASAFLASLVECIEALTIVLAVGAVRGWRGALGGAGAALAVLAGAVVVLGPAVRAVPLAPVRVVVGGLALWFGARWLRKAVRRAAGVLPLRDEARAYARETARLLAGSDVGAGWDREALGTAFRVTLLEGVEVVFIVAAAGASGRGLLAPAACGAVAALLLVMALGVVLHRPIARVPENTLKLVVGVMLCAFGVFWLGEGVGVAWPGGDASLLGLVVGVAGACAVAVLRKRKVGGTVL